MNDIVEIESLGNGGEGLCRVDGAVVLVPGTLPGDRVRLGALEKRRGVHWALTPDLIEPSTHRASPECPVFGACGGCNWLDFAYPAQGEWKCRIVKEVLRRIGAIEAEPAWVEEPSLRTAYRTRATFHPAEEGWGFYARASHTVVPIDSCPLAHERLNAAFQTLQSVRVSADVTLTVNPENDDVLVWSESEAPELNEYFPNAQSAKTYGSRTAFEFDGIPIVNGAFSQSSLPLNRKLRGVVSKALNNPSSLLDLFCGSGNFSLEYVPRAEVVGVDSSGPAVMAALRRSGADYRVGNETAMVELIRSRKWDVVLLDPPRAGAQKVARALASVRCGRIVYVSCDPATLARDSRVLAAAGWELQSLAVVDMFPNTPHIETVSLFIR